MTLIKSHVEGAQCQLMVQAIEGWFFADPERLEACYGAKFNAGSLPGRQNVEKIPKNEHVSALGGDPSDAEGPVPQDKALTAPARHCSGRSSARRRLALRPDFCDAIGKAGDKANAALHPDV